MKTSVDMKITYNYNTTSGRNRQRLTMLQMWRCTLPVISVGHRLRGFGSWGAKGSP